MARFSSIGYAHFLRNLVAATVAAAVVVVVVERIRLRKTAAKKEALCPRSHAAFLCKGTFHIEAKLAKDSMGPWVCV